MRNFGSCLAAMRGNCRRYDSVKGCVGFVYSMVKGGKGASASLDVYSFHGSTFYLTAYP